MAAHGQVEGGISSEQAATISSNPNRRPSNYSDVSAATSDDCGSAISLMAAMPVDSENRLGAGSIRAHAKSAVDHVEDPRRAEEGTSTTTDDCSSSNPSGRTTEAQEHLKPRRKFVPEPQETTKRSSRRQRDIDTSDTSPISPKRKFDPEPIEASTRSSRHRDDTKPRRKFAVEPVETIKMSSKDKETAPDATQIRRKFAVEPVETTSATSKERKGIGDAARRKFAVEPVETTVSSSRRPKHNDNVDVKGSSQDSQDSPSRSSSGGRKFSPELIATAKASYRKKPEIKSAVPRWLKDEIDDSNSWSAPEPEESRFSAANLAKRARKESRRHSYCVPDLPIIQSDSSDEEPITPQTPAIMSHYNSRDHNIPRLSKFGNRNNNEHKHQLDALAILRDQAVAAYGQQEDRVPFGHFGGDSDDEDYTLSVGQLSIEDNADPSLFRRMSGHDLHLVQEDMRRHHSRLEKAKRGLQEDTAGISRFSAAALAARHHLNLGHPAGSGYGSQRDAKPAPAGQAEDNEFAQMRKAASPPMGGEEIKFPFSISPKMTRCDPDQAPRPRRANSEDEEEHDIGTAGMWSAHITPIVQTEGPIGLWGGLCQKDESRPARPTTPQRSGLQTPAFEHSNPFEARTPGRGARTPRRLAQPWAAGSIWMPLTPPRSKQERISNNDVFTAALDSKLTLERQIDDEFPPRVITQIYNYLSLGYPAIARSFDDELSKISRISIAELRKGDRSLTGTMKGHVGVPEGEGDAEEDDDGRVKGCRRWDALRLYVKEWARQSPTFAEQGKIGTGMWGNNAPVRKGSWGF